ncbi:MAG: hypothetical protein NTW86_02425 [Candidatus Sumerlaeota bacterium]|nr:hypothetical protein [Candidatus Sumerlaeota bacterium]
MRDGVTAAALRAFLDYSAKCGVKAIKRAEVEEYVAICAKNEAGKDAERIKRGVEDLKRENAQALAERWKNSRLPTLEELAALIAARPQTDAERLGYPKRRGGPQKPLTPAETALAHAPVSSEASAIVLFPCFEAELKKRVLELRADCMRRLSRGDTSCIGWLEESDVIPADEECLALRVDPGADSRRRALKIALRGSGWVIFVLRETVEQEFPEARGALNRLYAQTYPGAAQALFPGIYAAKPAACGALQALHAQANSAGGLNQYDFPAAKSLSSSAPQSDAHRVGSSERRQRNRRLKGLLAEHLFEWRGKNCPTGTPFDEVKYEAFCEYLQKNVPEPAEG